MTRSEKLIEKAKENLEDSRCSNMFYYNRLANVVDSNTHIAPQRLEAFSAAVSALAILGHIDDDKMLSIFDDLCKNYPKISKALP